MDICPKCNRYSLEGIGNEFVQCLWRDCGHTFMPEGEKPIEKLKGLYWGEKMSNEFEIVSKINELIERFNQGIK